MPTEVVFNGKHFFRDPIHFTDWMWSREEGDSAKTISRDDEPLLCEALDELAKVQRS